MSEWTDQDLEEMIGSDRIDQLAWIAGCHKYKLVNDREIPDGLIIPEKALREFARSIVRECIEQVNQAIPETVCSASGAYSTARLAATARIRDCFDLDCEY